MERTAQVKPQKGITARLRAQKRRKQMAEDRYVYGAVDARDGLKSRASGIYCGASIERHHVVPRSLGGKTTTANVVSLTQKEHLAAHDKRLVVTPLSEAGCDGLVAFKWVDSDLLVIA